MEPSEERAMARWLSSDKLNADFLKQNMDRSSLHFVIKCTDCSPKEAPPLYEEVLLSQRNEDEGCFESYVVCASVRGQEIKHEYCCYSSSYGGPIRPDKFPNLRKDRG